MFKRGTRSFVVLFHPDGGGYVCTSCRVADGTLTVPAGTQYPVGLFVLVSPFAGLHIYFSSIERAHISEHELWDRARRSLDWSTLTKPQSHWSNMYEQVAGVIQWVLLLFVAWQSGSAASSANRVVAYLEFLQRSLSGGG